MSNVEDLRALIAAEAEHAEATKDYPMPSGTVYTKPNRAKSVIFTVRLNPDELAAVQQLAGKRGIPAATLVRGWIVRQLAAEHAAPTDAAADPAMFGRAPFDEPHVLAEPDPGLAAILERVGRAITGDHDLDGRETTRGEQPCPGVDETR